jgi:hypothetical protein
MASGVEGGLFHGPERWLADPERDPGKGTAELRPHDPAPVTEAVARALGGAAIAGAAAGAYAGAGPVDRAAAAGRLGALAVGASTDPAAPGTDEHTRRPSGSGSGGPGQGGAGMSLQETIAQVIALQRALQDQRRVVDGFLKSNGDTIELVRTELRGSSKGYDEQMLGALSQAEQSLKASLAALERASSALDRVRAI